MKLFSRRKRMPERPVPSLSLAQRQALEVAGIPPGSIPYETYRQMLGDSMVQTALTIKRLAVLSAPWKITLTQDTPEGRRRQAFIEQAFAQMQGSPGTLLAGAMDAFALGWSVQEVEWHLVGGSILPRRVLPRDPGMFGMQVTETGEVQALTLRVPGKREQSLPREKFILFSHRNGYGRVKGQSDLDAAYPHWRAKQGLMAAWRVHLERYASPTMAARYQRGLPPAEREGLLSALRNLSQHTAIIYPEEIELTALGGDRGSSTGFMEAVEFHNREMARAILGQTLTTDEGRRVGSLALGRVHLQVLLLQVGALRRELADQVMTEQLVKPLIEMNFGPGPIPVFEFEETDLDAFRTGKI